jgi:hypothetical protein
MGPRKVLAVPLMFLGIMKAWGVTKKGSGPGKKSPACGLILDHLLISV